MKTTGLEKEVWLNKFLPLLAGPTTKMEGRGLLEKGAYFRVFYKPFIVWINLLECLDAMVYVQYYKLNIVSNLRKTGKTYLYFDSKLIGML